MKIEVVISGNSPEEVVRAVNSPDVVQSIVKDVLQNCLGMEAVTEADFFILPATLAIPRFRYGVSSQSYGCEVNFIGRETAKVRNGGSEAYNNVAKTIGSIYAAVIASNLSEKASFGIVVKFRTEFARSEKGSYVPDKVGYYRQEVRGTKKTPTGGLRSFAPKRTSSPRNEITS